MKFLGSLPRSLFLHRSGKSYELDVNVSSVISSGQSMIDSFGGLWFFQTNCLVVLPHFVYTVTSPQPIKLREVFLLIIQGGAHYITFYYLFLSWKKILKYLFDDWKSFMIYNEREKERERENAVKTKMFLKKISMIVGFFPR